MKFAFFIILISLSAYSADFVEFYNTNRERYLERKDLLEVKDFSFNDFAFYRGVNIREKLSPRKIHFNSNLATLLSYKLFPQVIAEAQTSKTKTNYVAYSLAKSFESSVEIANPIELFDIVNHMFIEQKDILKFTFKDRVGFLLGFKILRVEDSDVEIIEVNGKKNSLMKLKVKLYLLDNEKKIKKFIDSSMTSNAYEEENLSSYNVFVKKMTFQIHYDGEVSVKDLGYRLETTSNVISAKLIDGETFNKLSTYLIDTNHYKELPFFENALVSKYLKEGHFDKNVKNNLTTSLKLKNILNSFSFLKNIDSSKRPLAFSLMAKILTLKLQRHGLKVEVHYQTMKLLKNDGLKFSMTIYGAYDHKKMLSAIQTSGFELDI